MSEQTTPGPEGSETSGVSPAADDVRSRGADDGAATGPFWRKVPLWGWIVAGVVVAAGLVVAILAATGAFTPAPQPTPPAETVTAAPPSPTAEPVERTIEATAFSDALPDTVLDLVLAEISEGGRWAEGEVEAIEAYALTYSDGADRTVTVDTAQYADEETAQRALPEVVLEDAETGEVTAGGAVVGEFWIAPTAGGTSVMWRNTTAVFFAEGVDDVVRDLFRAFPL